MTFVWKFQCLCLYFLFVQRQVEGTWPSTNSSAIQLLYLSQNITDITNIQSWYYQTRAMFYSAILLSHQYGITVGGEYLGWRLETTSGNAMNALRMTCEAVSTSNIVGIVGPSVSREAHVLAPFTEDIDIPIISYGATDPKLSDRIAYTSFYRTVPSDNDAALAMAKLFVRFNWTMCIIIYQNDEFGVGGVKALSDVFADSNITVTDTMIFDMTTLAIRGDLKGILTRSLARIVIVWADSTYATLILQSGLKADVVGPLFTWILGGDVLLTDFNDTWYDRLVGILSISPVVGNLAGAPVNQTLLNDAYTIWKKYEPESFPGTANVDYYTLFAFDATWALIESFARLCSNSNFSSCIGFTNTSFCFDRRALNMHSIFDILKTNTFLGVTGTVQFSINTTDRINGSYYIVKNVQRFSKTLNFVPVLVSTGSADWTQHAEKNIIVWPGQSLTVPTGYASIQGVTLRIGVKETVPFAMEKEIKDEYGNKKAKLVGYAVDLVYRLQEKMGFIANVTLIPENVTYSSLPDLIVNDKFDMIVGDITILAVRREKVSFSESIFDNTLRIIIRKKTSESYGRFAFLKPFPIILWIMIALVVLWSALLLYFYEVRHAELRKKPVISRIGMSIWYAIGTLIGYGVDFQAKTSPGRILTSGIYVVSVVLIAAYQATLTAKLTLSQSQDFIVGIDDIKNGKVPYNRIGILTGTSIEDYFLREITGGSRNYYPLTTKEDMYEKLLNKVIDASIMDSGVVEYATSAVYCNLTLVGAGFDHSSFGIMYPKKWLYEQILDVTVLSFREANVFNELQRKWFQATTCAQDSGTPDPTDLPFKAIADLFAVFGVISLLSILMYIGRIMHTHYRSKAIIPNDIALDTPPSPTPVSSLSYSDHMPFVRSHRHT
ncbi:unnamed protein product [Adineta ricciae]|uniref:Ionotropic glutamate receptor C-terminal domain-containing protein n=1 Tax=Adineta ricciae TaxID=249248 RepID=A0A814VH97_ADIRI|nr:unnamed protein product [Adineta ricciae]CAF1343339.1 unnamed protein product [Adineta ricciae]